MTKKEEKMKMEEAIAEQTPLPVQHKNTTVGKTVRTGLQAFAGLLVTVVPVLIVNDDFRNYVNAHPDWTWLLIVLPLVVSLATYVQNYLDPTVPNTVNSIIK